MPKVFLKDIKRSSFESEMFGDGKNGMAFQTFRCVEFPRVTRFWERENSKDEGFMYYAVDGQECLTLQEVIARLNMDEPDGDTDLPLPFPVSTIECALRIISELIVAHEEEFPAKWNLAKSRGEDLIKFWEADR